MGVLDRLILRDDQWERMSMHIIGDQRTRGFGPRQPDVCGSVNAARIFPKSTEVKFPSFAVQTVAEGCPFFGGRPRGRDGGFNVGGVISIAGVRA